MARFEALDELFDECLELPIKGKTYKVPSPSAEDGLRVQRITTMATKLFDKGEAVDTELLDDDEERDLISLCLGPTQDEMVANKVDWTWMRHAGLTAMFWITAGADAAEKYWNSGGNPELMAPNREARRAAAKKSGSAAASKTQKRGSTSGTSARRATAKGRRAAST
ncbi:MULTISPECIES: hypothetical protein [unclassified Streptomyces]|uniref:DUF7426 family protein n=1 Tax=unclassified Streptomyces TaxID=2593676 RepID=UPI0036E850B0